MRKLAPCREECVASLRAAGRCLGLDMAGLEKVCFAILVSPDLRMVGHLNDLACAVIDSKLDEIREELEGPSRSAIQSELNDYRLPSVMPRGFEDPVALWASEGGDDRFNR